MSSAKRIAGLDIIRTFAILFVIFVHTFLNMNFYGTPISGRPFYYYIVARSLFFICVPLFLLLTGYLQSSKKPEKSYYLSILPILASYIFISVLCLIVRNTLFKEQISVTNGIFMIFDYTADSYSWYVEMFIGLFLISPFLNFMYHGAATKKNKGILILSLILMTALPYFFYSFNSPAGQPLQYFLPKYWMAFYPITYYFIGSFIREYQPKINKALLFFSLVGYLLLLSYVLYRFNFEKTFSWRFLGEYGGLTTVIFAVMFFLLFYDVDIKNPVAKGIFKQISLSAFDMYLMSRIADLLIYEYYFKQQKGALPDLKYFALCGLVVIGLTFPAVQVKRLLFFLVTGFFRLVSRPFRHKENTI